MRHILSFVFVVFTASAAFAQQGGDAGLDGMIFTADEINLNELKWVKRPLVVFADTPNDPRFIEQMGYIEARLSALEALDVIVITDTDPAARTAIRRKLRPRGFGLVGIAKDGSIFLRKPAPWQVREITRAIDKLPARQRELRERPAADS